MNPYALLAAGILAEIAGTTSLKLSNGFSKPLPSIGVLLGYGAAFSLVSLTLEALPLGLVYGTWAALGIVGVTAIGVVGFGERLGAPAAVGVALIVAGVYCINVVSEMSVH